MPTCGVAYDGVGKYELLVLNQQFGSAIIRFNGYSHLRLDTRMFIGRFDDPGKDDLRGRIDQYVSPVYDDSLSILEAISETVCSSLAKFEAQWRERNFRGWR